MRATFAPFWKAKINFASNVDVTYRGYGVDIENTGAFST